MWSLLVLVIPLTFSNFVYSFSTVLYPSCGSSPLKQRRGCTPNSNRITNGVETEDGEIPWQVSIIIGYKGIPEVGSCGGSIISINSVLSAAHCFDAETISNVQYYFDIERTSVHAGGNGDKQSGTKLEIKKIIRHPRFQTTENGLINDLAIITMKEEFKFSTNIQAICLPLFNSSIPNIGSTMVASGWGKTSFTGTRSPHLLRGDLQVYSFDSVHCTKDVLSYASENSIMCVYNPSSSTCQGDSGGPLTMEVEGFCTLVGVTSQGVKCGESGYGALHTNVSHFLDWILDNISDSCSEPFII
ncbi:trypsin epsilon [Lepeophtheirus salmonis]